MNEDNGRYRVTCWKKVGYDYIAYTDDKDEALRFAYEQGIVPGNRVEMFDTKMRKELCPYDLYYALLKFNFTEFGSNVAVFFIQCGVDRYNHEKYVAMYVDKCGCVGTTMISGFDYRDFMRNSTLSKFSDSRDFLKGAFYDWIREAYPHKEFDKNTIRVFLLDTKNIGADSNIFEFKPRL